MTEKNPRVEVPRCASFATPLHRPAITVAIPVLASCGADANQLDTASAAAVPSSTATAAAGPSDQAGAYTTQRFSIPLAVNRPTWQSSPPDPEEPNFATWVSEDDTHAIRLLAPVNHYTPGTYMAVPLQANYVEFLTSLEPNGVELSDLTKTTIGGRAATVMNAKTNRSGLDGILGCPTDGMIADDCYGLQPDHPLRLAVIDAPGGRPLLIWSAKT